MIRVLRLGLLAVSILVSTTLALAVLQALANAAAKRYVCPPCGQTCDTKTFDHAGICPQCGMALVEQGSASAAPTAPETPRTKVAILLFEGVEIIDSMGPYEVFGAANFDVYTVGATPDPVTSAMGQRMVPKYSFADAPAPDVLVVPGGSVYGATHDAATLKWVKETSGQTRHTMSVCNGAFILAGAGLLDGLTATTTAGNLEKLRQQFPKVHVVGDQRYVDNGRIITTGGLSAGIDGALHVVERLRGQGYAQEVALGEEYDWNAHAKFARAALADRLIPDVHDPGLGDWEVVRTEGDTQRWQLVMEGTTDLAPATLLDRVSQVFAREGKWAAVNAGASAAANRREWTFTGTDGEPWTGVLSIAPRPGIARGFTTTLTIARRG